MALVKNILKVLGVLMLSLVFFLLLQYRSDLPVEYVEEKYQTPESHYMQVDGQKVHVRFMGEGEPVFLIHGSFSSLHTWDTWQKEMSPYFLTIAVDLPGHGLTGPSELKAYTVADYALLIQRLAEQLGLEEYHLAGNSMGGAVALQIASDRPDLVKSLNLVNASGAPTAKIVPRTLDDKKPTQSGGAWVFRLARNPLFSKILLKCTPKFLFKMNMKQVYYDESKISEAVIERYFELMRREGNRQATLDRLTSPRGSSIDFSRITMPTLITWGEYDSWIPVQNAYGFQEVIPGAKLKIFANAGHVPMEEIPTESVAEYLSFLGVEVRKDYFSSPKMMTYAY
ncbi:alpha/beta fold hydrolase [Algoriphagus namhaensis]